MIAWCPEHLPSLAELEQHYGQEVQPAVPYGVFCDWTDALRRELGTDLRLFVDRSAHACEYYRWCVILYETEYERYLQHGLYGL